MPKTGQTQVSVENMSGILLKSSNEGQPPVSYDDACKLARLGLALTKDSDGNWFMLPTNKKLTHDTNKTSMDNTELGFQYGDAIHGYKNMQVVSVQNGIVTINNKAFDKLDDKGAIYHADGTTAKKALTQYSQELKSYDIPKINNTKAKSFRQQLLSAFYPEKNSEVISRNFKK
jgi:sensor c-di-GMP phosphodiesterase-like protein